MVKISKYKNNYVKNNNMKINIPSLRIDQVCSDIHKISSAHREQVLKRETFNGQTALNSHADTTVADQKYVPICHTERSCDVAPFSDTYEPMKDVAVISAATGITSTTGRQYILVFHECLYMPKLSHTLINPNKLFYFQTQVQDNPYMTDTMSITILNGNFIACLESEGTNLFHNTWSPPQEELTLLPHIEITSQQPWYPHKITF